MLPRVNVLLATADAALLVRMKCMLEQDGHRVLVAEDGAEAWELYRNGDCRMVISAAEMPGMTGCELARRIRTERLAAPAYVLLLMPGGDHLQVQAAISAGVDDCLLEDPTPALVAMRLVLASRILSMQETLERQFRELDAVSRRLRRDLLAAEQAQRSLLPSIVPVVPGLEFSWYLKSCDEVGGDTLNVFRLDEMHLGFYVLDVSGHGVASALLAVQVSRFLHPLLGTASLLKKPSADPAGYLLAEPNEVLRDLNALFPSQPQSMQFFTMAYGLYHLQDHRVRIASAGHPGPLVVRASGSVHAPNLTGHPIGFFPSTVADFAQVEVSLGAGDRLLLYSDGASEAADGDGLIFGAQRLADGLARRGSLDLGLALDGVVSDLTRWRSGKPMADDVSLLAIGRRR